MKSKLVIVALLAFAAGGTCPSDVNNDGTVGINDFLQLLGDWGPCPNARVVAAAQREINGPQFNFQLWSDNTIRFRRDSVAIDCFNCDESFPPNGVWLIMDSPPSSASPADIVVGTGAGYPLWIHYADGSAYRTELFWFNTKGGCANGSANAACEFAWLPWEEVK